MRVLRQVTINDEQLKKFPFKRELSLQAYLMENEEILNLDDDIYCDVQIYDEEVSLVDGGVLKGRNGRIDLIASYGSEYIAIIEIKKGTLTEDHLEQLEAYLAQKEELLRLKNPILSTEKPNWIGILVGGSISDELKQKISVGYLYKSIPIAALTIERFKGIGNTYVITDLYFANKSKSKNYDKYQFGGTIYGKGRLVLAVMQQYIRDNPKVTLADLNRKFPPILPNDRATICIFDDAMGIYTTKGRGRHFLKPNEIVKLEDGIVVAVSSQWGVDNIGGFIKQATKQKYKIKTIKQNT